MKYIRIFVVVVASLSVLGIAGWFFVGWSISRAFQPALKEGGGFRQLADVLEASVGSTLARGDAQLQAGRATGNGALAFYQKNPQALQRDKKYFETWHSALAIADVGRKGEHQLGRWESSTAATWIASSQRMDAWGHAFCVQSDQQETIVVSPGPQALSSLDCNTLKITEKELAQMPQARLNPHVSGVLILFVKKSADGPSATDTVDLKNRTLHNQNSSLGGWPTFASQRLRMPHSSRFRRVGTTCHAA
jgi:hypothetical protein